jgi:hypothetical protein
MSELIINYTFVGLLVPLLFVLLFKRDKIKFSVIPTLYNKPIMTGSGPYLDNNGSNFDNPSRQDLERTVGKNWYAPPDQPGVLYGQLPDGQILIRYIDTYGHTKL